MKEPIKTNEDFLLNIHELLKSIQKKPEYQIINTPRDIVLSGGGIKGISFLGYFKYLNEKHYLDNIKSYSASSVGAIIALLLVLKYQPEQLINFVLDFDFSKIINYDINLFATQYGLNDGELLIKFIQGFLKHKGLSIDLTLKELYDYNPIDLFITTTNLTKQKKELLNWKTHPDLKITLAIRLTTSLPFIFTPVNYENCLYVDGSVVDDLPTDHLNNPDDALKISVKSSENNNDSLISYAYSILNIMLSKSINKNNLILIETGNITTDCFFIDRTDKKRLVDYGYLKAKFEDH